jgi:hypothetical protein
MALNGDYIQYQRWDQFHFYDYSVAVDSTGPINASLLFSVPWKLEELRFHFSTVVISVVYLELKISSVKDSGMNTILLSQSLNGVQDLTLHYSAPLLFFSEDTLTILASTISTGNLLGMEVVGWAVRG